MPPLKSSYIHPVDQPSLILELPLYPDRIGEEYKTLGGSVPQPHASRSAVQVTGRMSAMINFSAIFDEVEGFGLPLSLSVDEWQRLDEESRTIASQGYAQAAYTWIRTQLGPNTAPGKPGAKVFVLKLHHAVRNVVVWGCNITDVWQYPNGAMRRFRADFRCEEFTPYVLDPALFRKRPRKKGGASEKDAKAGNMAKAVEFILGKDPALRKEDAIRFILGHTAGARAGAVAPLSPPSRASGKRGSDAFFAVPLNRIDALQGARGGQVSRAFYRQQDPNGVVQRMLRRLQIITDPATQVISALAGNPSLRESRGTVSKDVQLFKLR
jgi:hypothetical protein